MRVGGVTHLAGAWPEVHHGRRRHRRAAVTAKPYWQIGEREPWRLS